MSNRQLLLLTVFQEGAAGLDGLRGLLVSTDLSPDQSDLHTLHTSRCLQRCESHEASRLQTGAVRLSGGQQDSTLPEASWFESGASSSISACKAVRKTEKANICDVTNSEIMERKMTEFTF